MQNTNEQNLSIEKPIEITRAVQLLYATLGIGAVKSSIDFFRISSETSVAFTLITLILTFAFIFFLIIKIADGRNWARIVLLIFFLLGIPLAIPIVLDEVKKNLFLGSLSLIQIVLQIIALVLMFMKNSNLWFRTRKNHLP